MLQVFQLLVNGVMAGAILAVPAIGFNIVFAVLQISNFSIAALIAVGAYAGYTANVLLGLPPLLAILAAFLISGAAGVASDRLALRPLRGYGAIAVAIASLALNMVLENIVRFIFGNDVRSLDVPMMRDWIFEGIHVGPQAVFNFLVAIAAMVALFSLLSFTTVGRAMRAVADNPTLANIKGIDPEKMARLAVFLGMGMAGIAGVLLALDTAVDPTIGMRVVLSVFAAAVLGGLGSIPGAVVGGLLIGLAEQLSTLVVPVAYSSAIGFAAIILALLLFPRGILGDR